MNPVSSVGSPPRALALLATAFAAVLLVGATEARAIPATHVECGDTITEDTKLASDLIGCPGPGLVIGADDITLDLNGHTVAGDGVSGDYFCDIGIANFRLRFDFGCPTHEVHHGVTIRDGSVRDFAHGVFVEGARHTTVRGLSTSAIEFNGIYLRGGAKNLVRKNSAADTYYSGISVGSGERGSLIEKNVVSGNQSGIEVQGFADGTRIERNVASNNREGIAIDSVCCVGEFVVANNVASDNSCIGVKLVDSGSTRIEGNRAIGNGGGCNYGGGIVAFDTGPSSNVIADNIASHNVGDGIFIDRYSPEAFVAENTADRNSDLGIEVEVSAIDGGGNRAHGNGDPQECMGVVCN